jgi:radical SAM/Cys-rich protein
MTEPVKSEPDSTFAGRLQQCGAYPLRAVAVNTLQLNITRKCNLACKHCHVQAGPNRTEMMSREILIDCIRAAEHPSITTIDITGGSPEMHPNIKWLVHEMSALDKRILLRSNLIVLLETQYHHLMDTFAAHNVKLVGSLPDYRAQRSDRQRGCGSYDRTIKAIRKLNAVGYGMADSGRMLDLMHNPAGAYLPASQPALETEYKRVLGREYHVFFNSLFCLVNCPIGRYLEYLKSSGNLEDYMGMLRNAFNPQTTQKVMCRTTLSVGWDGKLYDCDFNQVEHLSVNGGSPKHIRDFNYDLLAERHIETGEHCFACTAGAGSSCCGALTT